MCWSKIDTASMSSKNVDFAVSDLFYPYSRSLSQYTLFLLSRGLMDESKEQQYLSFRVVKCDLRLETAVSKVDAVLVMEN